MLFEKRRIILRKDNASIISDWITKQLENGKNYDDLLETVFVEGNDYYIISEGNRKKKTYNLKGLFGKVVSIDTLL